MTPDATLDVVVQGQVFTIDLKSDYYEVLVKAFADSRSTSIYQGPPGGITSTSELGRALQEKRHAVIQRKCKTVVSIYSSCNEQVLAAFDETTRSMDNDKSLYLRAACEGHIPVVNALIQSYRLATYDYFAYELSAWDVPIWYVRRPDSVGHTVLIFEYKGWDDKPRIRNKEGQDEEYMLIDTPVLRSSLQGEPSPGELELLDAGNLMRRGDFAGAVRRTSTALEAIVEAVLHRELTARLKEREVAERLARSKNDFPGRLRHYVRLSGRDFPEYLQTIIEEIREKRHAIVHRGERIPYAQRQVAQRLVDTGRWAYNWLEDRPDRQALRESLIAKRSLGAFGSIFTSRIGEEGVVVVPIHDVK